MCRRHPGENRRSGGARGAVFGALGSKCGLGPRRRQMLRLSPPPDVGGQVCPPVRRPWVGLAEESDAPSLWHGSQTLRFSGQAARGMTLRDRAAALFFPPLTAPVVTVVDHAFWGQRFQEPNTRNTPESSIWLDSSVRRQLARHPNASSKQSSVQRACEEAVLPHLPHAHRSPALQ
jgi:hypothetical protein